MLPQGRLVDLTHSITESSPTWEGSTGFTMNVTLDYSECTPPLTFRAQRFSTPAGIGTHIDAPAHRYEGGLCIPSIPLSHLMAPGIVIHSPHQGSSDYVVSICDLEAFERHHGTIPPNAFVIIYTGWSRHWNSPLAYRNVDSRGIKHFPTLSPEAAAFLLKRNVVGIGIDTLSPDPEESLYPVHTMMLKEDKYIVENVANANLLPAVGAFVIILPMKIANATEAPVRMVAIVP